MPDNHPTNVCTLLFDTPTAFNKFGWWLVSLIAASLFICHGSYALHQVPQRVIRLVKMRTELSFLFAGKTTQPLRLST